MKIPDDSEAPLTKPESLEEAEKIDGKTSSDPDEERLMRSVMEHDDQEIKDGKLVSESVDYNINSFQPDLMFENLVKNYQNAKRIFGPTMIRELTGYDDRFVEKNIKIPEFQSELKNRIQQSVEELKKKRMIDDQGRVTKEGIKLSALVRYTEELDKLETTGLGKQKKEHRHYGERADHELFKKGKHTYHDVDLKKSVKLAIRRGHKQVINSDLIAANREEHGKINIIYAVDSSGSMRGDKIKMAKQAGVALTYKAMQDLNKVGLIIFTSKIEESIAPCNDFMLLLEKLTAARAGLETDIASVIDEAVKLFTGIKGTKHLVLLTDALPTKTKEKKGPRQRVLEAAGIARDSGITISMVGVSLDEEGEKLAKRIVELGEGKLYRAKNIDDLDAIVLEDYEMFS